MPLLRFIIIVGIVMSIQMTSKTTSLISIIILTSIMAALLAYLIIYLSNYFLLIANLLPVSIISAYLLHKLKNDKGKLFANQTNKAHMPFLLFGILVVPISLTIMISLFYSYGVYLAAISLLIPLNFMPIFCYLPLSIYDRYFKKNAEEPIVLPLLTVIIPAYNEETNIKRTLDSVIQNDYPNKEIIVVDDGSVDQTYAIASTCMQELTGNRFSLIRKENGGKASAINLALLFSKGDIVIVIDADSMIEKSALREIVKEFQDPSTAAVAGKVKVFNKSNILTNCTALELVMGANILRPPFSLFGVVMIVPGGIGGFSKRSIIQRGLYDNDTLTEDFDLTMKLLKGGGRAVAIHAVSYTEVPKTIKDFYKQRTRWNRGNFQTLLKHKDIMRNGRYGMLYKFGYPITLLTFLLPAFLDFVVTGFAIIAILDGMWSSIIIPFTMFISLQFLLSAVAIVMDGNNDWKLMLYSPFAIIGYKQIINFIIVKSIFEVILHRNIKWI
jgi:cellulose synthase/poly-beta-1,6-N-acetylglucosamine synthase-like glycosyltransferase